MTGAKLGAVEDIPDGDSAGFVIDGPAGRRFFMAIRQGNDIFVYVNSCPHVGAPLDLRPGQFLNVEKTHIICANHGALFEIENGCCVAGPCVGKSLTATPIAIQQGNIMLVE